MMVFEERMIRSESVLEECEGGWGRESIQIWISNMKGSRECMTNRIYSSEK